MSVRSATAFRALSTRSLPRVGPGARHLSTALLPPAAASALRQLPRLYAGTITQSPRAQQLQVRYRFTSSGQRSSWADNPVIDYHELRPLVDQPTDDVTLIDVREPEEFNDGHIPSSVNIPLSQLKEAFSEKFHAADFQQRYSMPRPLPSQKLVVYCRSGKRSASAAEELQHRGWKSVRNYQGSWLDWEARRREKQQGESKWDDDD